MESCYRKYGQTLEPKKSKELENPILDYKKQCAVLTKQKKDLELEIAVLRDMFKKKDLGIFEVTEKHLVFQ